MSGIPRYSLYEALDILSGGCVRPSANDSHWNALDSRIKASNYTPYEYLYYLVHFSSETGQAYKVAILKIKNIVCSPTLWERFLVFKSSIKREILVKSRLQKDILNTYAKNSKLLDVLLNPIHEIGPALRVESAFQMLRMGESEYEQVLDKWGIRAGECLLGIPEISEYVPTTIKNIAEDNEYVARYIFPR